MTPNLYEFLSIAALVIWSTGFIGAFRYAIIVFERRGEEEIRRRQPELEALAARTREKP